MGEPGKAPNPPSLTVNVVLYHSDPTAVQHSADSLRNSVGIAQSRGELGRTAVRYGDCSKSPSFDEAGIAQLTKILGPACDVGYEWFNANLGSAGGNNRLFAKLDTDLVFILNPDAIVAPSTLATLLRAMEPGIGIVEARQLPLEHGKYYDARTGDTGWASGACSLIRAETVRAVDGYDSNTFFLYCDDVDFSWRTRLAGYRIVFEPKARVFHDKRLGADGKIVASASEIYYSAEAALLLAHKYSRSDILDQLRRDLADSTEAAHTRALDEFDRRRHDGNLPAQIDPERKVGEFIDGYYAVQRF